MLRFIPFPPASIQQAYDFAFLYLFGPRRNAFEQVYGARNSKNLFPGEEDSRKKEARGNPKQQLRASPSQRPPETDPRGNEKKSRKADQRNRRKCGRHVRPI